MSANESNAFHTAHVADALDRIYLGRLGYDDAADIAATLLSRNPGLRLLAERYSALTMTDAELDAAVRVAFEAL